VACDTTQGVVKINVYYVMLHIIFCWIIEYHIIPSVTRLDFYDRITFAMYIAVKYIFSLLQYTNLM
jgi:hypothetical protein